MLHRFYQGDPVSNDGKNCNISRNDQKLEKTMFDFPTKVPRIAGKLIRSKKANLSTFVYLDCRSLHKVHSFLKQCCARSSFPSKQSTSCS